MPYDVVGISAILPNIGKVKLMCEIVRRHQPKATIVVGGHIANRPGLRDVVDADHIVAGEGVAWFRALPRRGRGARRSATRSSCPPSARGRWACPSARARARRRPP